MATIKFENVIKSFDNGKNMVIPNLSFEIKDKEFVVLVGPSGCGKSTTLRMIAGLDDADSGNIYIDNILMNDIEPKNRNIAMVFQNYALYPHMSVYKNMALALKLRKVPRAIIDKKIKWAAKVLDIEPYLNRKPAALSGGQRQRVALGRAMVREPNVFLLDEPLSNLDAKLRTEMRSQIIMLHKKLDTTFVYVTHDQIEAMTMADRIIVMNNGVIQQFDTPNRIYNEPANIFVAGFIGSPQMNFIDAKITCYNGKLKASFAGCELNIPLNKIDCLSKYINRNVVLGIRPEHIRLSNIYDRCEEKCIVSIKSNFVEFLGNESNLHFNIGDNKCIAHLEGNFDKNEFDSVKIVIDNKFVLFFDKETEKTIR